MTFGLVFIVQFFDTPSQIMGGKIAFSVSISTDVSNLTGFSLCDIQARKMHQTLLKLKRYY